MSYIATFNVKNALTLSDLNGLVFNAGDGSLSIIENSPFTYSYSVIGSYYPIFSKSGYICDAYNLDLINLGTSTFSATYTNSINGTWGNGVLTGTSVGGTTILNGKLDLAHDDIRYVTYPALNNADSQQTGAIKFKATPQYSGTPSSVKVLFSIGKEPGSQINMIGLYHVSVSGNLMVFIADSTGTAIISNVFLSVWNPIAGTEYEFEFNYDITTGATRLFVDGIQQDITLTQTGVRDSNINLFYIGQVISNSIYTSNMLIDDVMVFDTVQHTSNYSPNYSIPESNNTIYLNQGISATNIGLVWDALLADHNIPFTFGAKNQKLIPSEVISDYYTDLSSVIGSMALDSTVAKESTLSTLAGVAALDSTVAKELTLSTLAGVAALDSTVAKELTLSTLAGVAALDSTVAKELTLSTLAGVAALDSTVAKELTLSTLAGVAALDSTVAKETTVNTLSSNIPGLVWDALIADYQDTGSTGESLNEARVHSIYDNVYMDQPIYSSNNILSSARIRVYSDADSVGTDNNVIATYIMTATELLGKVTTYKTVKL